MTVTTEQAKQAKAASSVINLRFIFGHRCVRRRQLSHIQSYELAGAKLLRLIAITRITGPFPPLRATDRDFAQKLRKLDLQIETIANGHGWIDTMAELRNALGNP